MPILQYFFFINHKIIFYLIIFIGNKYPDTRFPQNMCISHSYSLFTGTVSRAPLRWEPGLYTWFLSMDGFSKSCCSRFHPLNWSCGLLTYTHDSCPWMDSAEVAAVGSNPWTGVVVSSLCLSHKNIQHTALSCPSCCAGTLPGGGSSLTIRPHLKWCSPPLVLPVSWNFSDNFF